MADGKFDGIQTVLQINIIRIEGPFLAVQEFLQLTFFFLPGDIGAEIFNQLTIIRPRLGLQLNLFKYDLR